MTGNLSLSHISGQSSIHCAPPGNLRETRYNIWGNHHLLRDISLSLSLLILKSSMFKRSPLTTVRLMAG